MDLKNLKTDLIRRQAVAGKFGDLQCNFRTDVAPLINELELATKFLNDMKEHFEQNSTLERDDWNRLHGRILAFNPESDFAKFRL